MKNREQKRKAESILKRKNGNFKEYYNLGQELGKGQYGTTFLCTEKATGKKYACKSIPKVKLAMDDDVEDVRREIEIMHHLEGCLDILRDSIGHRSKKLLSLEFARSFGIQFRPCRYITRLNQT